MQLGYLPRMKVINTSYYNKGQVYLPTVNYLLFGCVILVILLFKNVNNLSSMYGMAITHIMFVTTVLAIFYFAYGEKWHWIKCVIFLAPLFIIDLIFVGTSYAKFLEGAWFPLIIALIICCIIMVWIKGKRILYVKKLTLQGDFINIINNDIEKYGHRIPGIAIFMNSSSDKVPNSLIMHLKHNKLIHEQVIFLSIISNDIPKVRKEDVLNISSWGVGFYNIIVNYGFSEVPNIDKILQTIEEKIKISLQEASFYLSKGIPVASKTSHLKIWQKIIFIFLFKNASSAVDFYNLPSNRVVELGFRFEI
ncbi:potassium transport protein Kup [Rickettsiales bacterium Ac37b]|nr:potassium transport protein Kup [Rickettsiales bacterium Ac37b]